MPVLFIFLLALTLCAHAQLNTNSPGFDERAKINSMRRLQALTFTTPAYQKEVLRLVVQEANKVAQELCLTETLPITESNLVAAYISPPRMAQRMGTFGNITTSNYTYYVSVGSKFSYLERAGVKTGYEQLRKDYLWPINRMDTNAVYQLATQLLAAVSMDVNALNRDCEVHIDAFTPEGKNGNHFVPVYWVYWMPKTGGSSGPAASVELFEPTKTIRQLRVNKAEYILRKPLEVTNADFVIVQTNRVEKTLVPDRRPVPFGNASSLR